MTCHSQIWTDSPMLEPVRASLRTNKPIRWNRVHDLPDFVYFNHSIHVQKGVGCATCHGRVDQMPLTWKAEPLTMEWCLSCHREPEQHLRPRDEVFDMELDAAGRDQLDAGPRAGQEDTTSRSTGSPTARRATDERHPPRARPTTTSDLTAIRARLAGQSGPRYWRSLEELAETRGVPATASTASSPSQASEWTDPASRRHVPEADGGLAGPGRGGGLHATSRPRRSCRMSGRPRSSSRASRCSSPRRSSLGGLRRRRAGREPHGPADEDRGQRRRTRPAWAPTDVFAQASLLTLYDPDRSQVVTCGGGRDQHLGRLPRRRAIAALDAQRAKQGAGLRVLTETVTSPTLARQLRALLDEFPEAKWHQYEPAGRDARPRPAPAGLRRGRRDALPLRQGRRDPVARRRLPRRRPGPPARTPASSPRGASRTRQAGMNRLYAVEPTPTITGRWPTTGCRCRRSEVAAFAQALARQLGGRGRAERPRGRPAAPGDAGSTPSSRDLQKHKGASLVVAGDDAAAVVHALAHAINQRWATSARRSSTPSRSRPEPVDQVASLRELVARHGGRRGRGAR